MTAIVQVIDPEPEGTIGGADLHVIDLASAQLQGGAHSPVILCTESTEYVSRLSKAGLQFVTHPRRGRYWRRLPAVERLPATFGAELVHSHGYDANYLVWWLRRRHQGWARLRWVMTCHGWIETTAVLKIKTWLDFRTYDDADAIIVCSSHQSPRLKGLRRPPVFIPNGVRRPVGGQRSNGDFRARFGIPSDRRLVAYIGRLSPEKRPDLFLAVAKRLTTLVPGVHFVVVGSGECWNQMQELSESLKLRSVVTFTGLVEDTYEAYPELSVLVLTSETETTSRVTMEAMMHGVPVVASRVGGLPFVIRDNVDGYLCDFGDVEAMAKRVAALLLDPVGCARIAGEARESAEARHSITLMRERVAAVYDDVLSNDA